MSFTRNWSNSDPAGSGQAKTAAAVWARLRQDLDERIAEIVGGISSLVGETVLADGVNVKSLAALTADVADAVLEINNTNNVIPKRTGATSFGNSSITDTGSVVQIANPLAVAGDTTITGFLTSSSHYYGYNSTITASQTRGASAKVLFGAAGGANGVAWDNTNDRYTLPVGFYLVTAGLTCHGTALLGSANTGTISIYKNGVLVQSTSTLVGPSDGVGASVSIAVPVISTVGTDYVEVYYGMGGGVVALDSAYFNVIKIP